MGLAAKTPYQAEMRKAVGDIRLVDGLSTAHLYVRNGPACATTFFTHYRRAAPSRSRETLAPPQSGPIKPSNVVSYIGSNEIPLVPSALGSADG
jgi:hypothetical protein